MDHSALKQIYCSPKPAKTIRIQNFLEELSDFSFDFQHISGKRIFVSDFLSCFSSDNTEHELIPYLTDTSLLNKASYMSQLDDVYKFNYNMCQGICTSHSFPITRSQSKTQKIAIPSLFTLSTDRPRPAAKASILRDPLALLTRKRSTALPLLDVSQPMPKKLKHGCPPKKRATEYIAELLFPVDVVGENLNDSLPTLYRVRRRRRQPTPATPQVDAPLGPDPFSDDDTALIQIHKPNV